VLAGATEDCVTEYQLLPLDDEFIFTHNPDAGVTVQSTMVTGQPNASPYAGTTAGTWGVDNSSFFSIFTDTPTYVDAPSLWGDEFALYGADWLVCYQTCLAMGSDNPTCAGECAAQGLTDGWAAAGIPHPGTSTGYIKEVDESFIAGNTNPTFHVEWHYIDGPVAETGLGDE